MKSAELGQTGGMAPAVQLDIFADSAEVILRNDIGQALRANDAVAAGAALLRLAALSPADPMLAPATVLLHSLRRCSEEPFPSHAALAMERHTASNEIGAAVRAVCGPSGGQAWFASLWSRLARRSEHLAFDAGRADDHAAPLFLLAGDWPAAARAVAGIESWRRIPAPLAWMAEARFRLDGLDTVWPLLAELAWLAPRRLDEIMRQLADPLLGRLRRAFDAGFELRGDIDDLAWFPAWALTEAPALASRLGLAQLSLRRPPEQAMRLMLELLGLERQGRHHDLVAGRRQLRDLCGPLYAAYMATR